MGTRYLVPRGKDSSNHVPAVVCDWSEAFLLCFWSARILFRPVLLSPHPWIDCYSRRTWKRSSIRARTERTRHKGLTMYVIRGLIWLVAVDRDLLCVDATATSRGNSRMVQFGNKRAAPTGPAPRSGPCLSVRLSRRRAVEITAEWEMLLKREAPAASRAGLRPRME